MILSNKEAEARLSSSNNLINRLRNGSSKNNAMSLFIPNKKLEEVIKPFNPFSNLTNISQDNISQDNTLPAAPADSIADHSATLDNLIENHDSQVKLGLAHDAALDVLNRSTKMLGEKLDDVRADRLPSVIAAASKVVESIRRERSEASKNSKDREVHYHFYTPQQKKLSDFEVIDVS